MPNSIAELVAGVVDELRSEAQASNLELHPSLEVELRNYARHEYVRELADSDLAEVIAGIGRHAFTYAQAEAGAHVRQVAAGSVRQALVALCDDTAFSDCSLVARSLLTNPLTRGEIVSNIVTQLRSEAAISKVDIHPSFEVELRNYAGHERVRSLGTPEMGVVLSGIGKRAFVYAQPIQGTSRRQVGAGGVRRAVLELCHDTFSDCSGAARTILEGSASSD